MVWGEGLRGRAGRKEVCGLLLSAPYIQLSPFLPMLLLHCPLSPFWMPSTSPSPCKYSFSVPNAFTHTHEYTLTFSALSVYLSYLLTHSYSLLSVSYFLSGQGRRQKEGGGVLPHPLFPSLVLLPPFILFLGRRISLLGAAI